MHCRWRGLATGVSPAEHHRDLPARALGQRGDAVGQRRAVRDGGHADPAQHMRVGQRHQHRAAFMHRGDEAPAAAAHEMVGDEQVGIAHQAEHRVNAVVANGPGDGLMDMNGGCVGHGGYTREPFFPE